MMFRVSLLCAVLASTCVSTSADISASSKAGLRLLSTSRRVANNNDDEDNSWLGSFSIKYVGCQSIVGFGEGGGREREEFDGSKVFQRQLVRFKLCPSDTCGSSCKGGGEYLTDMAQFVEAYYEAKMEAKEYACQQVEENCSCDDDANEDDDETCLAKCYAYAGLEGCIEQEYDDDQAQKQEEFEIRDALECRALDEDDDGSSPEYFVGATCSSGNRINLGVFADASCSSKVDPSIYSNYNYGVELPFTQESIVDSSCVACAEPNDGDDDGVEVNELCDRVYDEAAKCEKNLVGKYGETYTTDCKFIHSTVYKMAHPGRNITLLVLTCLFGLATAGLGYYAYHLHQTLTRNNVKLTGGIFS
mmetsp:Transcript_31879/g.46912  ORF Transcript_31879/g.46912 Transcript_31879/m.46912 type:complete len:361 (-) Transcript_31879:87-1169(-)